MRCTVASVTKPPIHRLASSSIPHMQKPTTVPLRVMATKTCTRSREVSDASAISRAVMVAVARRGSAYGTACDGILIQMETVYEAAGGADGLLRLAGAWHARVMADEVVSHAFSHGFHPEHTERLAAYWAEALGGPMTFSTEYGDETSVVRMHSGNGPHDEMDRRAIACFDQALADVGLADDERLRQVLHDYFAWATSTTMSGYHRSADDVPDGLDIPLWSWSGLVSTP